MSPAEYRHRLAWLAAGLRRAGHNAGVDLPVDYVQRVAADGIRHCDQLAVTAVGNGVAIHTAPDDDRQLPILLGYADPAGQWYRDGRCHSSPAATSAALAGCRHGRCAMNLDWMGRAACKGQPDTVFFPDSEDHGGRPDYTAARNICAACPARAECLAYALELNIGHGMFAGLTPTERANLSRQRSPKVA